MKDILVLTKMLLKGSGNATKKTSKSIFGKIILYVFVYLYIAGCIGYISYYAINSLMLVGIERIYIGLSYMGMFFVVMIQSVVTSLNLLYFSKDIEKLLPLPVKPIKIVVAKINCLIVYQYMLLSVVMIPILIVYTYLTKIAVSFFFINIAILFVFPIIPILISTLLISIVMRFTNFIKNKDVVQYFTAILTIAIIMGLQLINGNAGGEITNIEFAENISNINDILYNYSNYMFSLKYINRIVYRFEFGVNLENFAYIVLETAIIYLVSIFIISKLYLDTIMSTKASSVKKDIKKATYKENKIITSYVKLEMKKLVRNPIFFMQCVVPSIIFPIILLVPSLLSFKDMDKMELEMLFQEIYSVVNTSFGSMAILAVTVFMFMLNFCSITAFSRDGDNAGIMKSLPIKLNKQIYLKSIFGVVLNIFPILYITVFSKLIANNISNLNILCFIISAMLINIFNNLLSLIIDLKHPKINWTTEYAVVKQNLNMLFEVIYVIAEMFLIIVLGQIFMNMIAFYITIILIFGIANSIICRLINKNCERLFEKIY